MRPPRRRFAGFRYRLQAQDKRERREGREVGLCPARRSSRLLRQAAARGGIDPRVIKAEREAARARPDLALIIIGNEMRRSMTKHRSD